MKTNCPSCNRSYDVPAVTGKYICECGQEYRISHDGLISAGVSQPAVTHHCPDCEGLGRVSDILNGISIHKCPNCGGTGKIILSDIILRDQPQLTHHCPNCEATAREHAELQALCDRQAELLTSVARALRGPEPPLIDYGWADLPERAKAAVQERDDLRARLAAECDAVGAKAMDEDDDYYIIAERFRALLAETEGEQPA